jgi:apolipoprotein N-acyltransferase
MYFGLLVWNLLTTWWVSNASVAGGLFANMANPILMTVPLMLARNTGKRLGENAGLLAFIVYWMSFEFIHLRWELTWPWLSLGNVFALNHTWIQWYEYTGVFGGTLWILVANVLIYKIVSKYIFTQTENNQQKKKTALVFGTMFLFWIIIPIVISKNIYTHYVEKGTSTNVTVLQPNFDPYTEKFTIPYSIQMDKMLSLSLDGISDSTTFLVWPETAIQTEIWLDKLPYEKPVRDIQKALDSFPNLTAVVGINGFERYYDKSKVSPTARTFVTHNSKRDTIIYDIYNTALAINENGAQGYYHKSKLVPGVERMPYPGFFAFIGSWAIELGGISGSLGIQKERTVFFNKDSIGVAPVICYESIFGEYVSDYVNKGAGLIFIITNDGWWGKTNGYLQHNEYAKLRSIETRRSIARSANTGTSCFINQRGDVMQATEWREDAVINQSLKVNTTITFYTKHGDYLARIALIVSGLLAITAIVSRFRSKIKSN